MSDRIDRRHRVGGRTITLIAARLTLLAAGRPAATPRVRHPADPHAHEFDFEHYVALARQRRRSPTQ